MGDQQLRLKCIIAFSHQKKILYALAAVTSYSVWLWSPLIGEFSDLSIFLYQKQNSSGFLSCEQIWMYKLSHIYILAKA